ncbi:Long_chain fatty acid CoA ligase [Hexamita inflata]|uniref:Long_chain fatty acid CoA ligase n=1 Tax=Hexamita inflata TaxID=28002 RepID=A0ABP1JTZ6_9EUKA
MFECPFAKQDFEYEERLNMAHKLLANRAQHYPTRKCLGTRVIHADKRGHYQHYSYAESVHMASQLYHGLKSQGYKKGDMIGILSQNRPEWTIVDIACGALGLILVPLYDTQSQSDCDYVVKLTNLQLVFIEFSKLPKYGDVLKQNNVHVIVLDDSYSDRLFLIQNRDKIKFKLPSRTCQAEKPHEYYKLIDEIYVNEKQPAGKPHNEPWLCSRFIEAESMYEYEPRFMQVINGELIEYDDMMETYIEKIMKEDEGNMRFLEIIDSSFHSIIEKSHKLFTPKHTSITYFHPGQQTSPIHYPLDEVKPTDFYTLIFTSGTTSLPKAVCLTHKNFIATAETMQKTCLMNGDYAVQDYMISYLPLAHIYMRVLQGIAWEQIGAQGYQSESAKTLLDDITYCGPMALYLVPRVVQKIYDGIQAKVHKMNPIVKYLFNTFYAIRHNCFEEQAVKTHFNNSIREASREFLAEQYRMHYSQEFNLEKIMGQLSHLHPKQQQYLRQVYNSRNGPEYASRFLNSFGEPKYPKFTNIVFSKFDSMIGGRIRGSVSGSAAIQQNQGIFFRICFNSALFQGYGLSETAAGATVQSYFSANFTGVGSCLAEGMHIFLKSTDSYSVNDQPFPRGEIVIAGDAVFSHYYKQEESDESKQLRKQLNITDPTWGVYATGDVGQFNFITGELEIVDRIKNIVKLSQGEFVQLAEIETAVGKSSKVAQSYMYAQSFMNSIIGVVSCRERFEVHTKEEYLALSKQINTEMPPFLKSKGLKGFQVPKFFVIDTNEWTSENGLLTPAMKVKRGGCSAQFGSICDKIYEQLQLGPVTDEFLWELVKDKVEKK